MSAVKVFVVVLLLGLLSLVSGMTGLIITGNPLNRVVDKLITFGLLTLILSATTLLVTAAAIFVTMSYLP